MREELDHLTIAYRSAVRDYLAGAGESALRRAYEVGRSALAQGTGVLEMLHCYRKVVAGLPPRQESHSGAAWLPALDLFAESLSPFEMVLRGYQEANLALRRNLGELVAAHRAVEAERRRYQELFEFAPDAYLVTSLNGSILEANTAAGSLLGAPKASLPGRLLGDFVGEEDRAEVMSQLDRFQTGAARRRDDWQLVLLPGGDAPIAAALTVTLEEGGAGEAPGLRWLLRDVTARKRAEQARAESLVGHAEAEADRQFAFLADVSSLLASSLDYETTLSSVARLAVPYLADWCFIQVLEGPETVRQLAAAAPETVGLELKPMVARLLLPHERSSPPAMARMLRPEIVDPVDDAWIVDFAEGPENLHLLGQLGFRSAMFLPLLVRERALGAITLVRSSSGKRYARQDLVLAEDVARRCALALDNVRLYREVVEERDRAAEASHAKDDFLAILSHELRNPLTPVMGWTRILKSHEAIMRDAVLAEGVQSLERNVRNITRLVGDCLDLTRILRGRIRVEREMTDLNQIIRASIEAIRERASAKNLALTVELSSEALTVWGDATRLQQVVMNLLENAVKYTERGSILVRSLACGEEAEIQIHDTGVGIDPAQMEHIFQPFNRGADAWLASDSGLGIGLAISRQIVGMHSGRVWPESEGRGRGSTFRVRLPRTEARAGPSGGDPGRSGPDEPMSSVHLLLVEDSRDVLFVVRVELEKLGYQVTTAPDALQALERALEAPPDLIISDIKMPGMDGYELIRRIRATPALSAVPAIALTGFGMQADVERALESGYDASLTKPAEPDELDALIKRLIKRGCALDGRPWS